jgi:hypothetical protein
MSEINLVPNPVNHIENITKLLNSKEAFSFVRFSDGETEILKNRYLEINNGITIFRGKQFVNKYPQFDSKKFDPRIHQHIRKDLLESAMVKDMRFYKGIPSLHNNALKDREYMLRLNGGFDFNITFADLFLNSNYKKYRDDVVPLFSNYEKIYVIANYRAKLCGILHHAKHITVPDNFFATYQDNLNDIMASLVDIEKGALILSSASSLTKVVGHKLFMQRKDVTFLDVGTSINDLLSLNHNIRDYHAEHDSLIKKIFFRHKKGYKIQW